VFHSSPFRLVAALAIALLVGLILGLLLQRSVVSTLGKINPVVEATSMTRSAWRFGLAIFTTANAVGDLGKEADKARFHCRMRGKRGGVYLDSTSQCLKGIWPARRRRSSVRPWSEFDVRRQPTSRASTTPSQASAGRKFGRRLSAWRTTI
jgi:branched-subunit amino acid ABC-type transport system permease component